MKIGLISGHGDGDCGAVGVNDLREADLTVEAVQILSNIYSLFGVETVIYPYDRNAFKDIKNGIGLVVDFSDCDYVQEIHFNAARHDFYGDGEKAGCEILVQPDETYTSVEEHILESMEEYFPNRGIIKESHVVKWHVKAQGVSPALIEVCFIDDMDDMETYLNNKTEILATLAASTVEAFGEDPTPVVKPEPVEDAPSWDEDHAKHVTNGIYDACLFRGYDNNNETIVDGLMYDMTREDAFLAVYGSDECQKKMDILYLYRFIRDGGNPSNEEIEEWFRRYVDNDWTLKELATAMLRCEEFNNRYDVG